MTDKPTSPMDDPSDFEPGTEPDTDLDFEVGPEPDPELDIENDPLFASEPDAESDPEPDPAAPGFGAAPFPPPQPVRRRLVRDPYTHLGGVASGIGHHYGIDVSIVRIIVLLLAFGTGFGFLAYLLAWLIIPRADHWPPGGPVARPLDSMSKRDLGIGLAIVGLLATLAFGGAAGSVAVPLLLVSGGVWLLVQPATTPSPVSNGPDQTTMAFAAGSGTATAAPAPGGPVGPVGPTSSAYAFNPPGPPVPPRTKRRRGWIALLLIGIVLLVLIPIALIATFIGFVASADFIEEPITYVIDDAGDLPLFVDVDGGEITVDLTDIDPDDLDADDPGLIDLNVGAGSVTVFVPDGLDVDVDANAGLGDIEVFDQSVSGPASDMSVNNDDSVVDIEIDLGVGAIDVIRR